MPPTQRRWSAPTPIWRRLIADCLGLELDLVSVAWADWPLGVSSGKYDAVISNVTVTEERKEKFDFSTYRKDVLGFYVKSDSKITSIKEPKDVAGLKVTVGAGTNQEKILLEWDRQNVAAGLKPIEVQYYDDSAAEDLALQSGRVQTSYSTRMRLGPMPQLLTGKPSSSASFQRRLAADGRYCRYDAEGRGLAEAITIAINDLIANGKYGEVLSRWNVEAEAVDKAQTNPPGLPKSGS